MKIWGEPAQSRDIRRCQFPSLFLATSQTMTPTKTRNLPFYFCYRAKSTNTLNLNQLCRLWTQKLWRSWPGMSQVLPPSFRCLSDSWANLGPLLPSSSEGRLDETKREGRETDYFSSDWADAAAVAACESGVER